MPAAARHDIMRPLSDPATFAGATYDLNSSYADRDGDVWFFEDTINAEDGTWDMSSSADCYKNSLADVVLNWGPLKPHGRRHHHSADRTTEK